MEKMNDGKCFPAIVFVCVVTMDDACFFTMDERDAGTYSGVDTLDHSTIYCKFEGGARVERTLEMREWCNRGANDRGAKGVNLCS